MLAYTLALVKMMVIGDSISADGDYFWGGIFKSPGGVICFAFLTVNTGSVGGIAAPLYSSPRLYTFSFLLS